MKRPAGGADEWVLWYGSDSLLCTWYEDNVLYSGDAQKAKSRKAEHP